MVGTPEEFDVQPLTVQFIRMNPIKFPIEEPAFCAWIVVGAVTGTPGLGPWATAHEVVSSAKMNKMRFIASSFGLPAQKVYIRRVSVPTDRLQVAGGAGCDVHLAATVLLVP